jgi:hypothetical protein
MMKSKFQFICIVLGVMSTLFAHLGYATSFRDWSMTSDAHYERGVLFNPDIKNSRVAYIRAKDQNKRRDRESIVWKSFRCPTAGETYKLSMEIILQGGGIGAPHLQLHALESRFPKRVDALEKSGEWKIFEEVFIVPADCKFLGIGLSYSGNGTLFADNFYFGPADPGDEVNKIVTSISPHQLDVLFEENFSE